MARWKRTLIVTGLVVGCLILAVGTFLVVVLNDFSRDNYAFLEGRKPNWHTLFGPTETLTAAEPPVECRYYTFEGDFDSLKTRISSELEPLGFKHRVAEEGLVGWFTSTSAVWLQRGRSRSLKAALNGQSAAETGVTISCVKDAPHDWRLPIRLAFEPRH